jgi:hypothetical protein
VLGGLKGDEHERGAVGMAGQNAFGAEEWT